MNYRQMMTRATTILAAVALSLATHGEVMAGVTPYPALAPDLSSYDVTAGSTAVPVGKLWQERGVKFPGEVYDKPSWALSVARFASDQGSVPITVTASEPIVQYRIQPDSQGISASVNGNQLTFTLSAPTKIKLQINNLEEMYLFYDPPEVGAPQLGDPGVTNVMSFVIDNTGATKQTVQVQAALDHVHRQGGGVLYFPNGTYKVGHLDIRSNTHVYLSPGALIQGSGDFADFEYGRDWNDQLIEGPFIGIKDARNVKISGRGVIDGAGRALRDWQNNNPYWNGTKWTLTPGRKAKAMLLRPQSSSNIEIRDVILRDAYTWNLHILDSDYVNVDNVKIINELGVAGWWFNSGDMWNTCDGIDIDSSSHITINDCFIRGGDDCISIKPATDRYGLARSLVTDIDVTNTTVEGWNYFKLAEKVEGQTVTDIRLINFDGMTNINGGGIMLERGGEKMLYDNWLFENLRMDEATDAFVIYTLSLGDASDYVYMSNWTFRNVTLPNFDTSSILGSDETHTIAGFSFENLAISAKVITNAAEANISVNSWANITFRNGQGNTNSYFHEAESLPRTGTLSSSVVSDVNRSGDATVRTAQTSGSGQYVEFAVNVPVSGTYKVLVNYEEGGDKGRFDFEVDGNQIGTIDMYQYISRYFPRFETGVRARVAAFDHVTLAAGSHTFRFVRLDSNPDSSGNIGEWDCFTLVADDGVPTVRMMTGVHGAAESGPVAGSAIVTRTNNVGDLTVFYEVAGSAVNGIDYQALSGSLVIPHGQHSAPITIAPIGDDLKEGVETVRLTLRAGAGYRPAIPSGASIDILDRLASPLVGIAPAQSSFAENAGQGAVRITRQSTVGDLLVSYVVGGTATSGIDFQSLPLSVVIPAGQSFVDIPVVGISDTVVDPDEAVVITLAAGAYTVVGSGAATIHIDDDENPGTRTRLVSYDGITNNYATTNLNFSRTPSVVVGDYDGDAAGDDVRHTVAFSSAAPLNPASGYSGPAFYGGFLGERINSTGGAGMLARVRATTMANLTDSPYVSLSNSAASRNGLYGLIYFPTDSSTFDQYSTLELGTIARANVDLRWLVREGNQFWVSKQTMGETGAIRATLTFDSDGPDGYWAPYDPAANLNFNEAQAFQLKQFYDITAVGYLVDTSDSQNLVRTAECGFFAATGLVNAPTTQTLSLSVIDAIASEVASDPGQFQFTRSDTNGDLVIDYVLAGTARNADDYITLPGSVTIPNGQSVATVMVTPLEDAVIEGIESVSLAYARLSNPAYHVINGQVALDIQDGQYQPTVPSIILTATDASAAEAAQEPGVFSVTRAGGIAGDLTVNYTIGGTATNGTDYSTISGSVVIPDGQTSATITISPVDDSLIEGSETVTLTLAAGSGYTIGAQSSHAVMIVDNKVYEIPVASIASSGAVAFEAGGDPGAFTVTRSGARAGALTVFYTISGTASNGTDYTAISGSVVIPDGQTSATITIAPVDDSLIEGSETVTLTLAAGAGYAIGAQSSDTVTIADNDSDVPLSSIESWRQLYFGAPDNTGDGADLNDFDQDGIQNLLEFAFGLDPKQNSTGQIPTPQETGGNFVLAFTQPADVAGITYGAEWSETLAPGSWTDVPDTGNTAASPPEHIFSVPVGTKTNLFMRLKVTNPVSLSP